MQQEELSKQVFAEVMKRLNDTEKNNGPQATTKSAPALTEFVGTAIGDTIGLVIANVDPALRRMMKLEKGFNSIGIIGGRVGAGPHVLAADEAVKASNVQILSIEFPRDTKGGAGHGNLIIFGSEDVADARNAVEVTLGDLNRTMGDVYANDAGHLEFQYTARASYACQKAFNATLNKAFGLIVGAPAAIGVLMADVAVKAAQVDVVGYGSPGNGGTSFSNESILMVSGDPGAVKQAVMAARDVGLPLLESLGGKATSATTPYII